MTEPLGRNDLLLRAEELIAEWEFSSHSAGGSFDAFVKEMIQQQVEEVASTRVDMFVDKFVGEMLSRDEINATARQSLTAWLSRRAVKVIPPPTKKTRLSIERVLGTVSTNEAAMADATESLLASAYGLSQKGINAQRIAVELGLDEETAKKLIRRAQGRVAEVKALAKLYGIDSHDALRNIT